MPERDIVRLHAAWREAVLTLYLAEFTQYIPPNGVCMIRDYGWYSKKARGLRWKASEKRNESNDF